MSSMKNSRFKIRRVIVPLGIGNIFTQKYHQKKYASRTRVVEIWRVKCRQKCRVPAYRLSTYLSLSIQCLKMFQLELSDSMVKVIFLSLMVAR